jgi:alginate O-acetyltransferase complex protein AlgI
MDIISSPFVLFTLLILGVYYFLPRRPQNYWLLFASYAFVVTWDWRFAFALGAITIVNYLIALRLRRNNQGRRALLWVGIGFNVLALLFFRGADFFLPQIEALVRRLGVPTEAGGLQILIPLGLSYYVLQAISYLVDVYRGQIKAESDLVDFALYLAYFPKLIAGPIERARTFLSKLAQPRIVDNQLLARSITLIFLGITRKVLIADILSSSILLDVFELPSIYYPPELLLWLLIYAFALYNDFAGYTDIVRGVSGLFGIELAVNFRTPYFSRNFTEFWKRWHITLSEWLRDYVYFPVSRGLRRAHPSFQRVANLVLPPMLTMLASGMWHGLSVHMLVWGGLHGLYQIVERLLSLWHTPIPPQNQPLWRQLLGMVIVFMFVVLAWVPFRWELPAALDLWTALLNWSEIDIRYRRMLLLVPILFASLLIDILQYHSQDEFVFLRWPPLARAAGMALVLLLVYLATGGDFEQPFIYQAF